MGYFKPNSKNAIKLAIAVKSLTGVLALNEAFINGNQRTALIIFVIGAVANEVINFLSDDTKQNPTV